MKLFNTKTHQIEEFQPLDGRVTLKVAGRRQPQPNNSRLAGIRWLP